MKLKKRLCCILSCTLLSAMLWTSNVCASVSNGTYHASVSNSKSVADGTLKDCTFDSDSGSYELISEGADRGVKITPKAYDKGMVSIFPLDTSNSMAYTSKESRYIEARYDVYLDNLTTSSVRWEALSNVHVGIGGEATNNWASESIVFQGKKEGNTTNIVISNTNVEVMQSKWYTVILVLDKRTNSYRSYVKERGAADSTAIYSSEKKLPDAVNGKNITIYRICPVLSKNTTGGSLIIDNLSVTPFIKILESGEDLYNESVERVVYVKPGFSAAMYSFSGEKVTFADNGTGIYKITTPAVTSLGDKALRVAAEYKFTARKGSVDSFTSTLEEKISIKDNVNYDNVLIDAPFENINQYPEDKGQLKNPPTDGFATANYQHAALHEREDGTKFMQLYLDGINPEEAFLQTDSLLITDGQYAKVEFEVLPVSKNVNVALEGKGVTSFTESSVKEGWLKTIGNNESSAGNILGVPITDNMVGSWQKFEIYIDVLKGSADVYLNGKYKATTNKFMADKLAVTRFRLTGKIVKELDWTFDQETKNYQCVAFDNFKVSATSYIMEGLSDVGYNNDDGFVSAGTAPDTSKAIVLKLNDRLAVGNENAELIKVYDTQNNNPVPGTVDIKNADDGAEVSFIPADNALLKNTEVKLVIPANVKCVRNYAKRVDKIGDIYMAVEAKDYEHEIGKTVEVTFKVGDSTGLYIGKPVLKGKSGATTAIVEIDAPAASVEKAGVVYIAEFAGKKLTSAKVFPITYSAGLSYIVKNMPLSDEADAVKAFTWDSNLSPIFAAAEAD